MKCIMSTCTLYVSIMEKSHLLPDNSDMIIIATNTVYSGVHMKQILFFLLMLGISWLFEQYNI